MSQLVSILFTAFQILETGIADGIECLYVNPEVFKVHNFPDILRKQFIPGNPYNFFLAAYSGIICCWPLLISAALRFILLLLVHIPDKRYLTGTFFGIAICITIGDFWTLMTYDKNRSHERAYIYRNHRYFYFIHTCAEIATFAAILIFWIAPKLSARFKKHNL